MMVGNLDFPHENWILKLSFILLSYGSVLFSGYLIIRFVQLRCKVNHSFQKNALQRFLKNFAVGRVEYCEIPLHEPNDSVKTDLNDRKKTWSSIDVFYLFICFFGIESTLLCMGFFQERIMTQKYRRSGSNLEEFEDYFQDAQFLVLANRTVALVLCIIYISWTWKTQPVHTPPYYLHSFSSLSNIIASWFQYEALKFVSFPIQSVCKASKIIPTMVMGKILRLQRYSLFQYLLALVLVFGASLFFLSLADEKTNQRNKDSIGYSNTTFLNMELDQKTSFLEKFNQYFSLASGVILIMGYLAFDAFTPNWQKKLMEKSSITTSQMMFAVNSFSVLFCLISLIQQWTLFTSLNFVLSHDRILIDCLLLSLGSACGQVFIYATIRHFGPVVLSIIMTLRQIFSILLSSISFGHPLTTSGIFGLVLVFGVIFVDIFKSYRRKRSPN